MSQFIQIYAAEIPDAPLNLVNIPGITTGYQVGLSWNEGVYNGGSPVLDYRIGYRISSSNDAYTLFDKDFVPTTGTVINLTPGTTYSFIV
jgi:hypothetical protein